MNIYKKLFTILLSGILTLVFNPVFSQNCKLIIKLSGLKPNDSAVIRIDAGVQSTYIAVVKGKSDSSAQHTFSNLKDSLKWFVQINANGYFYESSKSSKINRDSAKLSYKLNRIIDTSKYMFSWKDDSSFVGHQQQSYIIKPPQINVLDTQFNIPSEFSSVILLQEWGILLDNRVKKWTEEDAYRIFVSIKELGYDVRAIENVQKSINSIWFLTDSSFKNDIKINTNKGIKYVYISRAAFTYAIPQVVTVDGIKGKFFSKRLQKAMLCFFTNFGKNGSEVNLIADRMFGLKFMTPNSELKKLMNETESNFQEFYATEKIEILAMHSEFPDGMKKQSDLKYLVRRIDGQQNPTYPAAPAIAWTSMKTIEYMSSGFADYSIEYIQRLILHEKAHFIWAHMLGDSIKSKWCDIGGWKRDTTQKSGWSTSKTTEFVSAYSHLKNPDEDMAESIAFYITNPDKLRSRSQKKFDFLNDYVMHGTRYIAKINKKMTFEVFNLFPDYNYPGKIKAVTVIVEGKPYEDKKIIVSIKLNIVDNAFDGASGAYTRLFSLQNTLVDISFQKANTKGDSLVGIAYLSKFAKAGYWRTSQIIVTDNVGNERYENNNHFGFKCFINNPLEDLDAPLYKDSTFDIDTAGTVISYGFDGNGKNATSGDTLQKIKLSWKFKEKISMKGGRVIARVIFPNLDTLPNGVKPQSESYFRDCQIGSESISRSTSDTTLYSPSVYQYIPCYFPSGYYTVTFMQMTDEARNVRSVWFDRDTANKVFLDKISINGNQRAFRDSVYVKTKYPDYWPPELDIDRIKIKATPTRPQKPDGETLFEMWMWIRDTSDYVKKSSGFSDGSYTLRDPQGKEFGYNISIVDGKYNGGGRYHDSRIDTNGYKWQEYYVKTVLPVGSAPGIWGVSSITITDKARNINRYSFVEYVRFEADNSFAGKLKVKLSLGNSSVINYNNSKTYSATVVGDSIKGKNYRLKLFSDNGGEVIIKSGKVSSDSFVISKINITGMNDGTLNGLIFITDSAYNLLGKANATGHIKTTRPTITVSCNSKLINTKTIDTVAIKIKTSSDSKKLTIYLFGDSTRLTKLDSVKTTIKSRDITIDSSFFNRQQDGRFYLGIYTTDTFNNQSEISIIGMLKDLTKPTLKLKKNFQIFLDSSGFANLNFTSIDSGSHDNFGILSKSISPSKFNCSNVGSNVVNLTLVDSNYNSSAIATTLTVIDKHKRTYQVTQDTTHVKDCLRDSITISTSNSWKQVSWSNGRNGSFVKLIKTGNYSVKLTNQNNCLYYDSFYILNPGKPKLSVTKIDSVKCSTFSDGAITNSIQGGFSPYSYLWNDATKQTTISATNLKKGTYKLIAKDIYGCADSISGTVNEPAKVALAISAIDSVNCYQGADGSITTSISGGSKGYKYTWNDATKQTTISATNLKKGTYKLIAKDIYGCADSISGTVNEPAKVALAISAIDSAYCFGYSDGKVTCSITGGSNGFIYSWNDPFKQSTIKAVNLIAGKYKLVVHDFHGCSDSIIAQVDEPEEIIPVINSSPLTIMGMPYKLNSTTTPNFKFNYNWSPKEKFGDQDTIIRPIITINGTTLIQLKVTNYKGCSGIDTITINGVIPIKDILPNAYTPNHDNLNETFGLPEIFETQQFQIRNLWGIIVFENSGTMVRWDGKFQNDYVPAGTYTYMIQAKLKNTDQIVSHQGTVTIIK